MSRRLVPLLSTMAEARQVLLLDNGSLEPAATLSLRRIAADLGCLLGREVVPVSLLHSHKVPAAELGGVPGEIFEPALKRRLAAGQRSFDILPLFFGPSGAITEYLPERVAQLRLSWPELDLRVAPYLAEKGASTGGPLVSLLEDSVRALLDGTGLQRVILVDHGSPRPEVTAVRDVVAQQLQERLRGSARSLTAASMERRAGAEYDFNEPLLERALRALPEGPQELILALLFISPGRHAGPGGDIVQICEAACAERPGLRVRITPLVGEHPGLLSLLAQRLGELSSCA